MASSSSSSSGSLSIGTSSSSSKSLIFSSNSVRLFVLPRGLPRFFCIKGASPAWRSAKCRRRSRLQLNPRQYSLKLGVLRFERTPYQRCSLAKDKDTSCPPLLTYPALQSPPNHVDQDACASNDT